MSFTSPILASSMSSAHAQQASLWAHHAWLLQDLQRPQHILLREAHFTPGHRCWCKDLKWSFFEDISLKGMTERNNIWNDFNLKSFEHLVLVFRCTCSARSAGRAHRGQLCAGHPRSQSHSPWDDPEARRRSPRFCCCRLGRRSNCLPDGHALVLLQVPSKMGSRTSLKHSYLSLFKVCPYFIETQRVIYIIYPKSSNVHCV